MGDVPLVRGQHGTGLRELDFLSKDLDSSSRIQWRVLRSCAYRGMLDTHHVARFADYHMPEGGNRKRFFFQKLEFSGV